ncbi:MAG: hypothetical protein QNJ94_20265 [Alphaproteobacteria bacterium]|nr:hypothetical protein [Alphaproteobacteria bacterium]
MSETPNTPALQDITSRLGQVTGHITAARDLVDKGNEVNLGGLDRVVESLCQDIQALKEADQNQCQPALVAMIDEFDRLTQALEQQRDSLQQQLKNVADRGRAVDAYGTGSAGKTPYLR